MSPGFETRQPWVLEGEPLSPWCLKESPSLPDSVSPPEQWGYLPQKVIVRMALLQAWLIVGAPQM